MSASFGLIIESLVAVLLMLTIGYCILLNSRLRRLRADELALKATIQELIAATEIAERAIGGLKLTVRDCDASLGETLRDAERYSNAIAAQVSSGIDVLDRLTQIIAAARPPAPMPAVTSLETPQSDDEAALAIPRDPQALMRAAQAFAARNRGGVSIAA